VPHVNKKHSIVEILLQNQRVDPTANENEALKTAMENNDLRMVQLLLSDDRSRKCGPS
jgi:hypothetical protein